MFFITLSTFDQIINKKLLNRVHKLELMFKKFSNDVLKYKYVGDARVIGAQLGIEFFNNQGLPDKKQVNHLVKSLLLKKIIVYAGGEKGNVLMLIPPIIIKYDNLKRALKVIEEEISNLR